ncbi:FdhE protein [Comamonas sp. BIGb0152]|uniref:formate dehydrogenase accessory protein FdhE n=1 Tax=Comamonas sp. BIGb0152 TaxID=2940601 RepID=UPI0021675A52|nr:formate dehydrogenase accessory protein FdhE [Comamonas sp. BIGb0152]MCS4293636.1 FdhE protein [Comamonas sp. BIGb0152]
MQRILQPGEIESLDHTSFPRVLLPNTSSLFLDRAQRIRQLADGNPIADYLLFIANLVQAQHKAAQGLQVAAPDAAAIAQAQQFSSPLLPAADHLDPIWHQVLDGMLGQLASADGLPEALQPLIAELQRCNTDDRNALAKRLLTKELAARDVGLAPFVMAALQVVFATRASQLRLTDIPFTDPATICPVCATEPVAGVVRIGGKMAGHRYLHCGCCATEWHMVRIKCSHCESTKGVRYQGLEGGKDVVLAETCTECGSYRKMVNQEKDPLAEPLADDLASLMLDLLMSEQTAFARASGNPLLFVAVAEPQAADADGTVPDLH